MTAGSKDLDATDWRILAELQADARITFSELGRRVSLTPPAVAERVRRLEQRGITEGYRARLNLEKLGLPILAFVTIKYSGSDHREHVQRLAECPEVLECHHVTGSDCFIAKVCARSMSHLEEVVAGIARIGTTTTTIAYSCTVADRVITGELATG
ncbi:putative transcriptional regulatory protein [Carbonactinospora thermoautotrophica]|uniref:Putative transcriptional regulatory protein n=1 Tax=Carbonactinospora thermoautotrophica TaxID=1469144 RepID=A0A132MT43_9ACTN|nr:Lrp/AsnC family transcriptional regulator [Carbonactinospora thermoautotrophica]KWX01013.1 putative transcriptional regulatory protein [Carbonactinospora thermoautotrophica]